VLSEAGKSTKALSLVSISGKASHYITYVTGVD